MKILSFLLVLFSSVQMFGQGCVAIKGATCGMVDGSSANLNKNQWSLGSEFRYFKSFRHFRGSEEEPNRVENGTEVINKSHFFDINLTYGINNRLYASAIIPFLYFDRSSMYEHGGNPPNGLGERHHTKSYGLSDVRLSMGYWLLNPDKHHKYNAALGLGVKLPTGKADAKDLFYNQGSKRDQDIKAVVDQSIQQGDGGFGISLDLQSYYIFKEKFIWSNNFYYLSNPSETNKILTRNGTSEFSCPDQFSVRTGMFYVTKVKGLNMYLGGRIEGVPSEDLIGGNAGFRRPGYAISAEPGIQYMHKSFNYNVNVPFALIRNRTQSYEDKLRTQSTGTYTHGDAAFADYLISVSATYRFN